MGGIRQGRRDSLAIVTDGTSTESSPQQRWTAVDGYIAEHLLPADAALDADDQTLW